MDTFRAIKEFYKEYDEDGRLQSKNGMVEYLTTMRYVDKYLKPDMRVLEIGAATGRYSHDLARRGYSVDAVELLRHNIDIFMKNTLPGEDVRIYQGNATNLSFLSDNTYDVTLLLGPMYHLFSVEAQRQALSEAIRVTKNGGVIMAAYCGNDATMIQYCFGRGMLKEKRYQELVDPITFKASSDPSEVFELYRKEDIDALMENFSVSRLHFVGTDMATHYMREIVDAMDDELYQMYLKYHFVICERPDMVGVSHHFLDVFRKNV